jgi:hypothetical protein
VKPQTNPIQRFIVTALKPSETDLTQSIRYTHGLGRKLTRTRETRTMYRPTAKLVTFLFINRRCVQLTI